MSLQRRGCGKGRGAWGTCGVRPWYGCDNGAPCGVTKRGEPRYAEPNGVVYMHAYIHWITPQHVRRLINEDGSQSRDLVSLRHKCLLLVSLYLLSYIMHRRLRKRHVLRVNQKPDPRTPYPYMREYTEQPSALIRARRYLYTSLRNFPTLNRCTSCTPPCSLSSTQERHRSRCRPHGQRCPCRLPPAWSELRGEPRRQAAP